MTMIKLTIPIFAEYYTITVDWSLLWLPLGVDGIRDCCMCDFFRVSARFKIDRIPSDT